MVFFLRSPMKNPQHHESDYQQESRPFRIALNQDRHESAGAPDYEACDGELRKCRSGKKAGYWAVSELIWAFINLVEILKVEGFAGGLLSSPIPPLVSRKS